MYYSLLLRPLNNGRLEAAMRAPLTAELKLILNAFGLAPDITYEDVFGIRSLGFESAALSPECINALSLHSHALWLCQRRDTEFIPIAGAFPARIGSDLKFILKYKGKTNEYFTSLLVNLAVLASRFSLSDRLTLMDPMCGKGTTLFEAVNRGYCALGLDADRRETDECAKYFKKYLETQRVKHVYARSSQTIQGQKPVFIDSFRFSAGQGEAFLHLAQADAALCKNVYPKERVHAIAADLPYGVQHAPSGKNGFEAMLKSVLPAWKKCLLPGGAAAVAFNTFTLPRDTVRLLMRESGFEVMEGGAWDEMRHWVEQAITRDVAVCRKP
ncbi:MAG: hypothetical protein II912_04760 [Clostridia bacterium]|nr:hypothetical protein [Clostridia bacterium]